MNLATVSLLERKTTLRSKGKKFAGLFSLKIFKERNRPTHEIDDGICIASITSLLCPLRHFLPHCLHVFPREGFKELREFLRRLLHIFLKQFFSNHHLHLWFFCHYILAWFFVPVILKARKLPLSP